MQEWITVRYNLQMPPIMHFNTSQIKKINDYRQTLGDRLSSRPNCNTYPSSLNRRQTNTLRLTWLWPSLCYSWSIMTWLEMLWVKCVWNNQTITAFLTFFFLQENQEHLICSTLQKSFHNQYFVLFSSIKPDQITDIKICFQRISPFLKCNPVWCQWNFLRSF